MTVVAFCAAVASVWMSTAVNTGLQLPHRMLVVPTLTVPPVPRLETLESVAFPACPHVEAQEDAWRLRSEQASASRRRHSTLRYLHTKSQPHNTLRTAAPVLSLQTEPIQHSRRERGCGPLRLLLQ